MHTVNWFDCVKCANARSEMEGLTPCYYISSATTTVYRSGELGLSNDWVRWEVDGYRLPTEAEWEKAARGGASGHRFPWADDTISHGRANYNAAASYSYDLSSGGNHPDYATGDAPYTSPVGAFTANGNGVYDMSGNVYEWRWDWYDGDYYSSSPDGDPRGPASGAERVKRGGSWNDNAYACRVARRGSNLPQDESSLLGFRLVRAAQ